jgi:DNA-binding beta-propeller fold protein YncE
MHMLPRVAELEERFPDVLVTIGVHSGKFTEEHRTENIRHACARLDVHHPVVNDRHFRIWRSYAVEAWPTVVLLSPDGYVLGSQAGEFDVEPLAGAIERVAAQAAEAGTLDRTPFDPGIDPNALQEPSGALRYPGRVIGHGKRLYVSDTGHRRVLELALDGTTAKVVRAWGNGEPGLEGGRPEETRLVEPQGLATDGTVLFVADRRGQTVRRIDLLTGLSETKAGTGDLARGSIGVAPAATQRLRSPWGLALDGTRLYITMAGSHQLCAVEFGAVDEPLLHIAGTGAENITDGPGEEATLAQPCGVTLGDNGVYVADSESSAVRWVGDQPGNPVVTGVGTGLFDFGDRDGVGEEALLQHDLDLTFRDGVVLVADTYNSKIKRVDPRTRGCETLPGEAGSGEALREPGGIAATPDGRVFVADTCHHRIVELDPDTGALTEITIEE